MQAAEAGYLGNVMKNQSRKGGPRSSGGPLLPSAQAGRSTKCPQDVAARSQAIVRWNKLSSAYAANLDEPGTRFQTFVLENYYCPVVRPLISSTSSHLIWISQTNGSSPAAGEFVASGLNYHFCAYPESFRVQIDSPFVFFSSVAADVVRLLLIRIGVFASDGVIFRIHDERSAALLDARSTMATTGAGQLSNFESGQTAQAHLQPNAQPINLPDQMSERQLDATPSEQACLCSSNLSELGESSTVKSTLSAPHLNAPANCISEFTAMATARPLHSTSQDKLLITSGKMHSKYQLSAVFLRTKRNAPLRKCFKCLASDHLVCDCRDPIKCTRCLRSGHKSSRCKNLVSSKMSDSSRSSTNTQPSPNTAAMIAATANLLHSHVANPPTQMPANPQNLVAIVPELEAPSVTPNLRPITTRRASPHSTAATRAPVFALPWYGVGGVPERQEEVVASDPDAAAAAMDDQSLEAPPTFTAGGHTEEEHESRVQKKRARCRRAKDSARKLRRSLRLKEKEEAGFELPEAKAARVQQAKFDFTGASRRLRNALSHSYLLSDNHYYSDDDESLTEIAAACGASKEELAGISGATASPSAEQL